MAISYTPTTIYGPNLVPVLEEIFFENKTIAEGYCTFQDNIKSGTIFTDPSVSVTAQTYTGAALSSSGSITLTDRTITLTKLEYKQTFLDEALRASRFNRDMKKGAWNIESNEFASKVLGVYGPKVSADAESLFWSGITSATKTAIAALTPGAAQGSMTAATQTAVAAMTAGPIDGIFARALYDNGAIGGYTKVTGTTVTAANIATEFGKIFAAITPTVMNAGDKDPVKIWAPRAWKQLIYNANNAVGAAQQVNFAVTGNDFSTSKVYFQGIEVLFVPTQNNLMAYANNLSAVNWCTDMLEDYNKVEIGKVANDGDTRFIRTIYAMQAHLARATNGVLYGG
jgi:hypothetical protein